MSTIGIDLGTTNSVVAIHEGKETKVIVNAEGSRLTPSVVGFSEDGRLVGRAARSQSVANPLRTVYSIKRLMGRRRSECAAEEKLVPYKVIGGPDELAAVEIDGKKYYPPEISAMILQDLRKSAETYLGKPVKEAVVTVPAYFNDAQRQATKEAGQIAGLDVKRIINEPTAAALAYGLEKRKNERIAVFDLGGGTFDISILDVGEGVFEVLATNGDTHLGGDDWDRCLVEYVADEFAKGTGIDVRKDPMALQRLVEACEKAKCDLSAMPQTTINLPYIANVGGAPKHLTTTITRARFEGLCEHLFERMRQPVLSCLKDAGIGPEKIDEVVLVGGSTRMPKTQVICKEIFLGKEPHKGVNPDEVVAVGAAIQGAVLSGEVHDIVLLDVTPLSLGVETLGGVMTKLIDRNTTIPTRKSEVFSTATDSQPAVDIHVLQGERKMASNNRTLGRFQLTGIPPAARGIPQIEVSFNIDANGIVTVTAQDQATKKEAKVEIKSSSGLGKADIDRMVKEAADNEKDDDRRAELAEARNKADNLLYQAEKFLREYGGRLTPAVKTKAEETAKAMKAIIGKPDATADALTGAFDALNTALSACSAELYRGSEAQQQVPPQPAQTGPAMPPNPAPSSTGKADGQVVDAEFRVIDEKK